MANTAQGEAECCICHKTPTQVLHFIVQHEYTVLLLICWFCVGGLIASALNFGLREWIYKDAKQTKPVISPLLLPNQLEIIDVQVL